MATGEKSFSSRGRQVHKPDFKPVPAGKYTLKLNGNTAEVRTSQKKPGTPPWVNVTFEILDTATSEGGKNRKLFKNFWLKSGVDKNGRSTLDYGDGLVAFSKALNTDFDLPMREVTYDDPESGEEVTVDVLDAKAVKQWLIDNDGATAEANIKVYSYTTDSGDKREANDIRDFIYPEETETEEETEEEAEEVEEKPAPKKAAAPAKGKKR
jgi:hypothetical protein